MYVGLILLVRIVFLSNDFLAILGDQCSVLGILILKGIGCLVLAAQCFAGSLFSVLDIEVA